MNNPQHGAQSLDELKYELELERVKHEIDRPYLEATTQIAVNAIKTVVVINGAAAIAILAFLGNGQQSASKAMETASLTSALYLFGMGVFAGAACNMFAYFFQAFARERSDKPKSGHVLRFLAVLSGVGGMFLFLFGVHLAAQAFSP